MSKKKRVILIVVALLLLAALPVAVSAKVSKWVATMSAGAELHEVVGANPVGTATLRGTATGYHFKVRVAGLSGPVGGVHLHGPATVAENAPVLVTLCGNPAPAALATCTMEGSTLVIEGDITSVLMHQWGVNGRTFRGWLNDSLVYVNVHTGANPAGEARGQLNPFED